MARRLAYCEQAHVVFATPSSRLPMRCAAPAHPMSHSLCIMARASLPDNRMVSGAAATSAMPPVPPRDPRAAGGGVQGPRRTRRLQVATLRDWRMSWWGEATCHSR